MKLLKLKIGNVKERFRSLHAGFDITFHTLDNHEAMEDFNPFCFAGLNGSGKSNVLEALSSIFFHLEFCVARYMPDSFRNNFERTKSSPDAYTLEYLIGQHHRKYYAINLFDKVTIKKEIGKEPEMFIQKFPFDESMEKVKISLIPSENRDTSAEGKNYLPAHIIGYSSGENETLSFPFVKSRLVHLAEYKQATKDKLDKYDEPENSLIYIDKNMSQAVLLACLLFENKETLKPLEDEIGIIGLQSFRLHINLHEFEFKTKSIKDNKIPILTLLEEQIHNLKNCATLWFTDRNILVLDFYVTDATKQAFKKNFNNSSFEVFQLFRILYELNLHFIEDKIVEDIYQSKDYYSEGKLPEGSSEQNVFYFSDFYISKRINESGEVKDLLLSNFSDGEHQFLHTIGITILLKTRRAIILLDEPETHFNPSWRAKFIKILNDSIVAGHPGGFNIHLLKDILLTSHSPFIISDCLPDNVIFFDKDEKTKKVKAQKASEFGLNTFGTSEEIILDRLFNYRQSIGDLSNSILKDINFDEINTYKEKEDIKVKLRKLGDSIEKDMILARLNRIKIKD